VKWSDRLHGGTESNHVHDRSTEEGADEVKWSDRLHGGTESNHVHLRMRRRSEMVRSTSRRDREQPRTSEDAQKK
jgi:hypothetical protein